MSTTILARPEAVFRDVGHMLDTLPVPDGIALHVDLSNHVHRNGAVAKRIVVDLHGDCCAYIASVLGYLYGDHEPSRDFLLNDETRVREWNLPLYDRAIVRNFSTPLAESEAS